MANIYLITTQEVKENTVIGGNIDPDNLTPLIYDAQIMILEPILGTKLYDKIVTDFDGNALTGLYLQMFDDYIKPVLWHSVYADYLRNGNVLAKNAGVFTHTPEDGVASDLDNIIYTAKGAKSKADVYIGRLDRFLCDKKADIPEYTSNQDEDYDIKPKRDIRTAIGWYFK